MLMARIDEGEGIVVRFAGRGGGPVLSFGLGPWNLPGQAALSTLPHSRQQVS